MSSLSPLCLSCSCLYGSVTRLLVFLGSSDPYVKFKLAGKEVFRSKTIHKNLNPVWDEKMTLIVDSLSEPLYVKVKTWTHTLMHKASPHEFLMNISNESVGMFVFLPGRCLTTTLAFKMTSWVLLTSTWSLWSSRGMLA